MNLLTKIKEELLSSKATHRVVGIITPLENEPHRFHFVDLSSFDLHERYTILNENNQPVGQMFGGTIDGSLTLGEQYRICVTE